MVSAHSETVEKVEKICIKLNFNQKNSNSAWTLPWWELRKFHGPRNIFGFSYNKLAFGQTRIPAAADPIEHISEEKFLLQIFGKMETL